MGTLFQEVDFSDGVISIDRLQKMSENQDFMYNDIISKPFGIIGFNEAAPTVQQTWTSSLTSQRQSIASDYTGMGTPVMDCVRVTPLTNNRKVTVHMKFNYRPLGTTGTPKSIEYRVFLLYRDGEQIGYYNSGLSNAGRAHTLNVSFPDVLKDKNVEYKYHLYCETGGTVADDTILYRYDFPIQLWVEDRDSTPVPNLGYKTISWSVGDAITLDKLKQMSINQEVIRKEILKRPMGVLARAQYNGPSVTNNTTAQTAFFTVPSGRFLKFISKQPYKANAVNTDITMGIYDPDRAVQANTAIFPDAWNGGGTTYGADAMDERIYWAAAGTYRFQLGIGSNGITEALVNELDTAYLIVEDMGSGSTMDYSGTVIV